MQKITI